MKKIVLRKNNRQWDRLIQANARCCLPAVFAAISLLATSATAQFDWNTAASPRPQGLTGSAHDLRRNTSLSAASSRTNICRFCHVPHDGDSAAGPPLWNQPPATGRLTWDRARTGRETIPPMDKASANLAPSMPCLNCHDGTVGRNVLLARVGRFATLRNPELDPTSSKPRSGRNYYSTAVASNSHPIGVAQPSGRGRSIPFKNPDGRNGIDYVNSRVQCGSCHDPHNTTYPHFLKASNNSDEICLSCHDL